MIYVFLIFIYILQAIPSYGSGAISLPEPPMLEQSPKSKEIKKIAKIIEDPVEREKLLKTLKVLATAQEAEEKKHGISLVSYITPVVHFFTNYASTLFNAIKTVPNYANHLIEYFKVETNRENLWEALKWFPLLIMIGAIMEGCLVWFFRRRLMVQKRPLKPSRYHENEHLYAYVRLFYPFLYSLLFLPLFVSNPIIGNWMIGFWLMLYAIRVFVHERKKWVYSQKLSEKRSSKVDSKGKFLIQLLGGVSLWIILMSVLSLGLEVKVYGNDFLIKLIIAMSFPLMVFYFREWRVKEMPKYLQQSNTLQTVPHKVAPIINLMIHYLPWVIFLVSIPLVINKIFFDSHLWEAYASACLETLLLLAIFLWGRANIDGIAQYELPKRQVGQIHALTNYMAPLRLPIIRSFQWIWHLAFFATLMGIWNLCLSNLFIDALSHPFTKTLTTIAIIWGLLYVLSLGLDFFVQFHTKPQTIRGKRKEPTIFAKTFGPMLHGVARWLILLVAFFVTLESLGFDLKILVYLMSAFAFAISLGAQSLVKDIINGFFALVDGSFAVGEVVTVGTHTGTVESLSLRAILLRHRDGSLQKIPFSEVGNIINKSRDFTVVPIDVATSYKTKIGKVYEALTKAYEEIAKDSIFGPMIIEPLTVSGIDRFAENAVHVSASIKITPDPNNKFAQEFYRRLKIHLDSLKITPPISFQEAWNKE